MKTISRIILQFLGLVVFYTCAFSQSSLTSAQNDYAGGNYADAAEAYEAVLEKEGVSSELLYDLGNAYARGGDYGNAAVAYLRALRLDPGNKAAANNLKYIREKAAEANKAELKGKKLSLYEDDEPFFTRLNKKISRDHRSDTWASWAVVSFLLFSICLGLYLFVSAVGIKKTGFFAGIVFLALSLLFMIFAWMAASYKSDLAVVTGAKVKLHTEASMESKESPTALTRGTVMKVLDTFPSGDPDPKWYKVRLNSDFTGWLPESEVKAVE